MIETARQIAGDCSNVSWRVADFHETTSPLGPCDGVISSAALHWAKSRRTVFASLDSCLIPGGLFHSALMLKGTLGEIHASRAAIAPHKPSCATLPEFLDIMQELEETGWTCEHAEERTYLTVHTSAQQALQNLHHQGVTGGAYSRGASPLTRSELQSLVAHYDREFAWGGGVSVTYKVGFFSFRKS